MPDPTRPLQDPAASCAHASQHSQPAPQATPMDRAQSAEYVCARVQRWLEHAVIGLNLCPFAKSVHVRRQIHYVVSAADTETELMDALHQQIAELLALDAQVRDTTLLIIPALFTQFLEFQFFVDRATRQLRRQGLQGVVQLAHFHPQFQFADSADDDIVNNTNRAPYAIVHVLREDSITRVMPDEALAQVIFERNQQTLRDLGCAGWQALQNQIDAITPHATTPAP